MKKSALLIIALLAASFAGFSQDTASFRKFDVGPFEVVDEDYNYRLRDGMNIPEYFGFRRTLEKNSFQAGLFFSLPCTGKVSTYGIGFVWKRKILDNWFLNTGVSAAIPSAKSVNLLYRDNGGGSSPEIEKETSSSVVSVYFGIPISIEYMCGGNSLLSYYFSFGLTPGGYFNGAFKADVYFGDGSWLPKDRYFRPGFYLAPRADAGVYIPVGKYYVRTGILLEYKIDLTDSNVRNRFKYGIGCFMPGIDLSFVF